jgi:hypothetical protein
VAAGVERGGGRLEIVGGHATGRFRPRFGVRLARGEREDDGEPVWATSAGDWGRVRSRHGRGRHGATVTRGRTHAEGKGDKEWARRAPYHTGVLQRRLGTEDWRRRGEIVAAQGRRCPWVERQHGSARA